jgi:hypothetical protein
MHEAEPVGDGVDTAWRQSLTGGTSSKRRGCEGRSYATGNPVTDWAAAFVTHTLVPSVATASGSSKP